MTTRGGAPGTAGSGYRAPDFTEAERATLARIEQAAAAPESWDANEAVRRVEALAEWFERGRGATSNAYAAPG